MDKSKSDKLKEVLNQTLTSEEIEKKLKDEIKTQASKKAAKKENKEHTKEALENLETKVEKQNHEEENKKERVKAKKQETKLEEPKIKETKPEEIKIEEAKFQKIKEDNPLNKKVEIPNVRDKKQEAKSMNIVLYLVIVIALLLLGIVIYLFSGTDNTPQEVQASVIKKGQEESLEKTSQSNSEVMLEKVVLKQNEQEEKDIKKNEVLEEETAKKKETKEEPKEELVETNTNKQMQEEKVAKESAEPKVIIKEVIKEKIVTKIEKLDKKSFKSYYNSSKYNTLKCYNFKAGGIFPDKSCKNSLDKFLKANKDALRIQIIPVIAQSDYIIFKKLDESMQTLDKAYQDRVKEYMFRGLSRERVLEMTWKIKESLGNDTVLTPTNYYVKSKKNNKGVIIKAYH